MLNLPHICIINWCLPKLCWNFFWSAHGAWNAPLFRLSLLCRLLVLKSILTGTWGASSVWACRKVLHLVLIQRKSIKKYQLSWCWAHLKYLNAKILLGSKGELCKNELSQKNMDKVAMVYDKFRMLILLILHDNFWQSSPSYCPSNCRAVVCPTPCIFLPASLLLFQKSCNRPVRRLS